jgi:hypothetical protein
MNICEFSSKRKEKKIDVSTGFIGRKEGESIHLFDINMYKCVVDSIR